MQVWEPLSGRRRGEWLAQIPVSAGKVCTWASIHFPREQINDATDLVAAFVGSRTPYPGSGAPA